MKYYLRKTKIEKDKEDVMTETKFEKKDYDKQVSDVAFTKTQIHICKHEEGLPCELVNL